MGSRFSSKWRQFDAREVLRHFYVALFVRLSVSFFVLDNATESYTHTKVNSLWNNQTDLEIIKVSSDSREPLGRLYWSGSLTETGRPQKLRSQHFYNKSNMERTQQTADTHSDQWTVCSHSRARARARVHFYRGCWLVCWLCDDGAFPKRAADDRIVDFRPTTPRCALATTTTLHVSSVPFFAASFLVKTVYRIPDSLSSHSILGLPLQFLSPTSSSTLKLCKTALLRDSSSNQLTSHDSQVSFVI